MRCLCESLLYCLLFQPLFSWPLFGCLLFIIVLRTYIGYLHLKGDAYTIITIGEGCKDCSLPECKIPQEVRDLFESSSCIVPVDEIFDPVKEILDFIESEL